LTSIEPSTAHPLDLIQEDMKQVDLVIGARLDTEVPLVREVAQYII
jgi:octaprenyl-diphosphate synthase